ncbi:MAG: type IV secretion system protein TraC [Gammaproteobacteria bacterium]|nr:type IV secretion system protein TraC [Gammaproteobacteria bacterium]MBP9728832.1 type IV secretion system protein TraC [Gammaproteobacteria bacterium]
MLQALGAKILAWMGDEAGQNPSYTEDFYKKLAQFYSLGSLFPYERFDEKTGLFFNQDSIGFVLETPPLVGNSEEMQKEIAGIFQHLLPEESSLQVLFWADPHIGPFLEAWRDLRQEPSIQGLSQKRVDHLKGFAFDSPTPPYALRHFRVLWSFSQSVPSPNPVILEAITQVKTQVQTSLEMLGLSVLPWKAEQLLNTLSAMLNLDPSTCESESKTWNPLEPLCEQLGHPDNHLSIEPNQLATHRGRLKIRTYQVTNYPRLWSLSSMSALIGDESRDMAQIPCPFMIHYGIYIPKQSGPRARILAKATYVDRQVHSPIGRYLPSLQEEAEELAFVRGQLAKNERVVQTTLQVILLAKEEQLSTAEQILLNLYRSQEWQLRANTFFHLPMFLSSLPMMWGKGKILALLAHKKLKTTLSSESANLLPLQGEWQGTATLGLLLAGRRGQLLSWYPFDNRAGNYNVCVVGRSGSGKSVFMQELMTTTLGLGGRVFVLDVGRSFEKTCFLLKGQFIEFKAKTPLCLNPFSTIPLQHEEISQDALAMLKPILILMAAPTQGVDDMEAALLEKAILEVWQTFKQGATISHIADYLLQHSEPKARDLGTMLFPYTTQGIYGRFFNGPSNVCLENPLIVIELEELKERKDLQAVVVQMMIINITNRMFLGDRKIPFQIFFDEAWDLLRGAQSGLFIETLARRLRKYYGSLVVGTQSVNDLFASPAAQAAFDNSDWMCLLSQKTESIEALKQSGRLALTPAMSAQLKSVKTKQGHYAEVMIYGPHGYAVGRLLLDPYSNLLYSTKAQDYAQVKALTEQGLSLGEAIASLLTQQKESRDANTVL